LSKSSHWVKDDIVGRVKLTFLDCQKFTDDRRQTVEVIAVQSLLLIEELHLIQGKVLFNKGGINTDFNVIGIFLATVVHTSEEHAGFLVSCHLH